MEAMIENKILEQKLEAKNATVQAKSDEIARYEARNTQLEKWCAETQDRVERESQSTEETNKRMAELTEHYWSQSRENFAHMEQKLNTHDKHLARITELEHLIETYRAALPRPIETSEIEKLIDARIVASVPVPAKPRRLRDETPIFK